MPLRCWLALCGRRFLRICGALGFRASVEEDKRALAAARSDPDARPLTSCAAQGDDAVEEGLGQASDWEAKGAVVGQAQC